MDVMDALAGRGRYCLPRRVLLTLLLLWRTRLVTALSNRIREAKSISGIPSPTASWNMANCLMTCVPAEGRTVEYARASRAMGHSHHCRHVPRRHGCRHVHRVWADRAFGQAPGSAR